MRRRQLKKLWKRLRDLKRQKPGYEALIGKIAVARHEAGRTASLVTVTLPEPPEKGRRSQRTSFSFELDKEKLRQVRRREGRYLLRTNLNGTDPARLWEFYLQLTEVESAFKTDKSLKSVKSVNTPGSAPKLSIFIPVTSLKSQVAMGRDKMDSVMQQAMKADAVPLIRYKLTEMTVKGTVPDSGTPVKFDTKGDLAISGVTNNVAMEVTMERLDGDKLKFSGEKVITMPDFGVAPPVLSLLGLGKITTGTNATVKFEWVLVPKVVAAPAAAPAPADNK